MSPPGASPAAGQAPSILAGPIIRRTEPTAIRIWLATDGPVPVRAEVYDPSVDEATFEFGPASPLAETGALARSVLGTGEGPNVETRKLGPVLHVYLITVTPKSGSFPTDKILAYDVKLDDKSLDDLGLTDALSYAPYRFPTLMIASTLRRILHGSCRKFHGEGEDVITNADELIAANVSSAAERPAALMLTGDQIYADDIDKKIYGLMIRLAQRLLPDETVPDDLALHEIPEGTRDLFLKPPMKSGVTSGECKNHALGFGEYASLYLLAWNPDLRALGIGTALEEFDLATHTATSAARRAMANIPTYMIFDDHDVTDDWFFNKKWKERALKAPRGRRFIANALAAFWAFQGWGNAPHQFPAGFKDTIERYLGIPQNNKPEASEFERTLLEHQPWSFVSPTSPLVIFLDTRTLRADVEGLVHAVELMNREAYQAIAAQARVAGLKQGDPVVLVSPTPVLGHPLVEAVQAALGGANIQHFGDVEAWAANQGGRPHLLTFLMNDLGLKSCVVLSGDVHYGFHATGEFEQDGRRLMLAQLTSSSLHNLEWKPALITIKELLASTSPVLEVGWNRLPTGARKVLLAASFAAGARQDSKLSDRLLYASERAHRYHEPLVLPGEIADQLSLPPYDWQLRFRLGATASVLPKRLTAVRDTNLGDVLLQLSKARVTSTLTTRNNDRRGGITTVTARFHDRGGAYRRGAARPRARVPTPSDDKWERLAEHLLLWYFALRNIDFALRNTDWGKPILQFADFRLEKLPRQFLPGGRGDYIKTQVHSITFELHGTNIERLGATLTQRFEAILPPDQALVTINTGLPLRVGSEIRWLISPATALPPVKKQIERLMKLLSVLPLDEEKRRDIHRALNRMVAEEDPSRRPFDVRVAELYSSEERFGFRVVTLANHPYGGARAWEIRRHGASLYSFTTVEFNSYAWLPDAIVEIGSDAKQTRDLWTFMLTQFVADLGARVTAPADPTLLPLVDVTFLPVQTGTQILVPETVSASGLGRWVRQNFPAMDEMVKDGSV